MTATLPDVLGFVMNALEADGALCEASEEPGSERAMVVLPAPLALRLETPDACTLALRAELEGDVPCGHGSPLLEKLVAEARTRCPTVTQRLDVDAPRPGHVRSLAERFVLRNGVTEVGQVTMAATRYAVAYVAYVVEADDRREGLIRVVTAPDGSEPDQAVQARLDVTSSALFLDAPPAAEATGEAAHWIALRADRAVRVAAAPRLAEVTRRHTRDHDRIAEYFAALMAEASAPRRKTEAAAIEAKVSHLVAERDKKLRDLSERFASTVRASLAGVAWMEIPGAVVSVRLRRRKEERTILLRVPAFASTVDRLACDGCGAATAKPAACDDRLHLLCEGCAPNAQGRLACTACATR